ncbi:hypothetical protein C5F47_08890 [Nitrosopumilus cobalaminigenes]|uniref:Uncharacterized protein n=1 Tax=Nitrosopumilus cobalaminigenes TaxID=1470066 RepID=A0A7D5RCR7_9ARCH|nr:hypothetical protein [Nitrosopumilus cobalaminigenes]QLH03645.1 hypothetical protein C5F47_08890 [Nitrosopumilus cobalaminigenes]
MSNGRPTAQQQITLQNKLRSYYEKGISATQAARHCNINPKTACKYFREWSNEINQTESKEFENKITEMRLQHLTVLDRQLAELNYMFESVYHGRTFQDKLNIVKMILQIMDRKEKLFKDIKNTPKILKKKSRE